MRLGKRITLLSVALALVAAYLFAGCVSRDIGYHCDFTGSTKSWTAWPFGIRTDHEYRTSPLESFVAVNAPGRLEHKWVSYSGTCRNIFGKPVMFGHGRPNELFHIAHEYLRVFVEQNSQEVVFDLYETLRGNDRDEIRVRIAEIEDEIDQLLR